MTSDPIAVVLVDDHPLYLAGVRGALDATKDLRVVGSAVDATSALQLVRSIVPDVLLLDLHLPDGSGLDVIRTITEEKLPTAILVLSMLDDHESLYRAMKSGARGYLVKGADAAEITSAVRIVADGGAVFGPTVAARMLLSLTTVAPVAQPAPFPELTERERETLEELAAGRSNAAIAARLGLSPKTVRNYVSSIFMKLHAADRADVIIRARDAGLGKSIDGR